MTKCDLCGQKDGKYNTEIEGTIMHTCIDCSKFGNVKDKKNFKIIVEDKKKKETNEPIYLFVKNYGSELKKAREKLGLKMDEMAKRLNQKESTLHQIESENWKPPIELARKLEKELKIKIVEEIISEETENNNKNQKQKKYEKEEMTLGDLIKIKKK